MNISKRAFLMAGSALTLTLGTAPFAAFAARADGVQIDIEGYVDDKPRNSQFTLNKEQLQALQEQKARQRPRFLSDLILKWLKKQFPAMEWPKIQDKVGQEITAHLTKQLANGAGWSDDGGEEPLPKIRIKFRCKFKPPSAWELSLEISF